MDSIAASLMASGTSKSGRPIDRLIGSFIFAARSKTLRMPEASTPIARWEMYFERSRMVMRMENVKWQMANGGKTDRPSLYHLPFSVFPCEKRQLRCRKDRFTAVVYFFFAGAAALAAGAPAPFAPVAGAAPLAGA